MIAGQPDHDVQGTVTDGRCPLKAVAGRARPGMGSAVRPVRDRLRHLPAVLLFLVGSVLAPRVASPSTVAEQRARLPPPAKCTDKIAGLWKSHDYRPDRQMWTEFTIEVRRVEGSDTALVGTITNHTWDGTEADVQPGPCDAMTLRTVISMDAQGSVEGDTLFFGGVGKWRLDRQICGSFNYGYNLDNFTGVVDHTIEEFQSVNNDGGMSINEPTVFRRVRCFDQPTQPSKAVPRPSFQPPARGGCACGH